VFESGAPKTEVAKGHHPTKLTEIMPVNVPESWTAGQLRKLVETGLGLVETGLVCAGSLLLGRSRVASLGVSVTHVRLAAAALLVGRVAASFTPPRFCSCASVWSDPSCGGTQYGCPDVSCENPDERPWCLAESYPCDSSTPVVDLGYMDYDYESTDSGDGDVPGVALHNGVAWFYCNPEPSPPSPPLSPQPPRAPLQLTGPCSLTDGGSCAASPNYPNSDEECSIIGVPPVGLETVAFEVDLESSCRFDYLTVNGVKYCGFSGPNGVVAEDGVIEWSSDNWSSGRGWKARPGSLTSRCFTSLMPLLPLPSDLLGGSAAFATAIAAFTAFAAIATTRLAAAFSAVTTAVAAVAAATTAGRPRLCRRGERGRAPLPDHGGCCFASQRLNLPAAQCALQAGQPDQVRLQHQGDRFEQRRGRDARRPGTDQALFPLGRLQPHPALQKFSETLRDCCGSTNFLRCRQALTRSSSRRAAMCALAACASEAEKHALPDESR